MSHATIRSTQIWVQRLTSLSLNILHAVYDGPFAAKDAARDAQVSHRTAEKWFAWLSTPRADVFLRLVQSNERMRAELLHRLGGHGYGDEVARGGRMDAALHQRAAGAAGGLDRSADTAAGVITGQGS